MKKTGYRQTGETIQSKVSCGRAGRAIRCTGELLLALGIAPHMNGYAALLNGTVLLSVQEPGRRIPLGDVLYPAAEQFSDGSGQNAEHAIRDTVRKTWQRGPTELRSTLFPETRIPTNAELLYTLAACVRARLRDRT